MLCGEAGTGKDTVAKRLAERGAVAVGQADLLKRVVNSLYSPIDDIPMFDILFGPSELRKHKVMTKFSYNTFLIEKIQKHGIPREIAYPISEYAKSNEEVPCRTVLQTIGTDIVRGIEPDFWFDSTLQICKEILKGDWSYKKHVGLCWSKDTNPSMVVITDPSMVVITDGRFRNEICNAKFNNITTVRLRRDVEIGKHISEQELSTIPQHLFDFTINNNGTFEELNKQIDGLEKEILKQPVSMEKYL